MSKRRYLLLVLVLVVALPLVGCKGKQKSIEKGRSKVGQIGDTFKDTTGKIGDSLKDFGDVIDTGKTIVDEIDKIGDIADPKMNPQYIALKKREIQRAYDDYKDAKERYEDALWLIGNRSGKKKEMERARNEYLDKVEALSKSKVDFDHDVYKNTEGFMIWRKPARKKKWQGSLNQHCGFILNRADDNYKRARKEYEDEWWLFPWAKLSKKKAMERAKGERDDTFDRVEDMWADAELISTPGLKTRVIIPEGQPAEDGSSIEVDPGADM